MSPVLKSIWVGVFVLAAGAAAHATAPGFAAWYVIVDGDGAQLGHAAREVRQTADGREIVESQQLYLSEEGSTAAVLTSRSVYLEDRAGRIAAIDKELRNGREWTRIAARIADGVAYVTRETPAGTWTGEVALPAGVRFDEGEALFRAWDRAATPRLEFLNFDIDAPDIERVVVEAGPPDAEGRATAIRWRYERDQLVGVARLVFADDGRVLEVAQPMFGATIRVLETDRETAQRLHPPYRVMASVSTRSPYRISDAAARGHVRYRFAFRDGMSFTPPQTGEQRVTIQDGLVSVDVCATCGPGLAADAAALADALRPTVWMQSDHRRLRELAEPIARMDVSDARKMELLLARARPYLGRIDFRGHYSALDTLTRRAGDCTEAAVLLAALGRAAGIPTRVASGVVYSRARYHGVSNAFLPHSWTLAYVDGAWRSYDLALETFDSTHIALTIGDGDARSIAAAAQLSGLLRWEGLAEIRSRGAG